MDYPFENLSPERFQQFCQAILVREYPHVQCLPVAQPDGGRDAFSLLMSEGSSEFIVFQVKFVRNPAAESNPRNWLLNTIEGELDKIKGLIPKGASRYILLTNIGGSAHLDSGSIDRMNSLLGRDLAIPSQCLWRDDLSRRLDSAWDLKWVYPELMTGPDLIRSIVEGGLSEEKERRASTVRAFVRDQYRLDQQVRFKQVELQNRLLDLFIDVPLESRHTLARRAQQKFHLIARSIRRRPPHATEPETDAARIEVSMREHFYPREDHQAAGAATLLLDPSAQQHLPRIVLEGAPGQGKSTIVQYVCQVHRMRLLSECDLDLVPESHRLNPVRIPFKVDLRDLATWLGKNNPFVSEETASTPPGWYKSLESFLAALVGHHSGGADFTYDDLIAVCKLSAILLVFDGLDEVADITRRREVVEEIVKGVHRLKENCASLQVIVTSRPAAFANSPGLPADDYPYFQLGPVTKALIEDYANKWLKARRVDPGQNAEFKKILREKLDEPHLRDLARNPMQLAILLSLIHTRGSSLPEKRTALYDAYIELFFNREAEKSQVVREHRDLLIDIHRYLAWIIHAEAERGHERGSVSNDRLHALVQDYLAKEGHDVGLAQQLFTGMVERVVALVSRVEGTYEFEVQSLREYFVARYLYDTAPYSPPGQEQRGTKPDRFDAIARNFYWLNVTRFYAGCYSKGELASLVDRLQELAKEKGYRNTSHPRALAATLLADWVFAQHPKSARDVVGLLLDGIGLRFVLSYSNSHVGPNAPLVLPKKCGHDELLERCFQSLRDHPPREYAYDLLELIGANSSHAEAQQMWLREVSQTTGEERTRWLEYDLNLQALARLPLGDLEDLLADGPDANARLLTAFRGRRLDFVQATEERCQGIIEAVLQGNVHAARQRRDSVLDLFCHSLDPQRYSESFSLRRPVALSQLWRRVHPQAVPLNVEDLGNIPGYANLAQCCDLIRVADSESNRTAAEWASDLTPWDRIVEKTRSIWGDNWACFHLANVASGIRSSTQSWREFSDLLDHSRALCPRARYARLRAGASKWWATELGSATTDLDRTFASLVVLTWGTADTIATSLDLLAPILDSLPEGNWLRLLDALEKSLSPTREFSESRLLTFELRRLPARLSGRSATAIATRAKTKERRGIYQKYLKEYQGSDPGILKFCLRQALDLSNVDKEEWRPDLGLIERAYRLGVVAAPWMYRTLGHVRFRYQPSIPLPLAEQIAKRADCFPTGLVALAEARCRIAVAEQTTPVGRIAEKDGWFPP